MVRYSGLVVCEVQKVADRWYCCVLIKVFDCDDENRGSNSDPEATENV